MKSYCDLRRRRAINPLSSLITKSSLTGAKSLRVHARFISFLLLLTFLATNAGAQQSRRVHQQTVQFKSELIGKVLPYNALLPPAYFKSNKRYPVLYLLHGLFGHHDDWITRTNLAEYAASYDVIIVTPEGNDSWYVDSATVPADKYESYILRELIPDVDARFRTIKDKRARGIAGLSMGGYGALKYGLKYPDYFVFAGSLSGALDPANRSDEHPGFIWNVLRPSLTVAFGAPNSSVRQVNDLHQIARNLTADRIASLPYLYLDCGLEDGFLATNREFADILVSRKITHQYRQLPGGHSWEYWDRQVREIIRLYADLTGNSVTRIH